MFDLPQSGVGDSPYDNPQYNFDKARRRRNNLGNESGVPLLTFHSCGNSFERRCDNHDAAENCPDTCRANRGIGGGRDPE